MVAPARGLSPTDLGAVREALAAGRHPRVVFTESAGQIAGQVGQVVSLADPAASDDWIVVRFGKDELPFATQDLAMPVRGARSAKAAPPPGPPRVDAKRPPSQPAKADAGVTTPPPTSAQQPPAPQPEAPLKPELPRPELPAQPEAPPRPAKPRAPTSLLVTLAYTDREWTVAATHGNRTIAKSRPIRPTDALRMVAMLDLPGLHDAVESIIAAERAEAEARAQRLRAELAEIESRLSELTSRS